ncbi:MAG TPA: amino acid adenylation domain-containing protein [Pyrinomonadaceae bacterium]|nr:amino acid adenylation domain-containing protein [Pyrinomonadaceae bacterium]
MQREITSGFRLSPQQTHLWTLQHERTEMPERARCLIVIEGELNVEVLRRAVEVVTQRHDALRLTFERLPGMTIPLQVLGESNDVWSPAELPTTFHASLTVLSPVLHRLLLSVPALCADERSLQNLVREIGVAYGTCQGREPADEPLQYLTASEWLNELLESEEAAGGKQYWRERNISAALDLRLPSELTPPAITEFAPRSLTVWFDDRTTRALHDNFTVAEQLLACWFLLCRRLSGESDIVIGTYFDGRTDEELQEALGLYEKYLPIGCQFEKDVTFAGCLREVHDAIDAAGEWQECFSWSEAVDLDEGQFFPYCFAYTQPLPPFASGGLTFAVEESFTCVDRFKLKLSCRPEENRLLIEFHYDPNFFAEQDVKRLAQEYEVLLREAVTHPESASEELDSLGHDERQFLLHDFNDTELDYGAPLFLHTFVEQQVARTSGAIALVSEDDRLTYAELNARANQLAHYLISRGVTTETFVAVCLERSVEMIVALLAVLKAGAAYVPFDPQSPPDRLAVMLDDVSPRLVITTSTSRHVLPAHINAFELDREWTILANESDANPARPMLPDQLAYVLYTSGSTGKPKGVMISHRAICNHMHWMQRALPLTEHDTLLQKTVFTFDASIWELFVPLFTGARLVLARPGEQQYSSYLVEAMLEHNVTVLQVVPSMLTVLLGEPLLQECRSLRRMCVGGEALPVAQVKRFYQLLNAEVVNLYGPTEAAIETIYFVCDQAEIEQRSGGVVPIGRPIPNIKVYVLDERLNPTPCGVAGELHIGGICLARGYLNRPDLTAERFIPDPLSRVEGERLYRTGDVARILADGTVEFLGRRDEQVKLRGYRIELGEIEAALNAHPEVRESVTTVREDTPGDQRLIAYLVPQAELLDQKEIETNGSNLPPEALTTSALQHYLRPRLPEYMIPSTFVLMEKLPTLPNGKINRKALPAPDTARRDRANTYVAPRNQTEEHLAAFWSEILGVERIGINDNFFDLGGHSLLATEAISRIRETFQTDLSLRSFFAAPTIAALAVSIAENLAAQVSEAELEAVMAELEQLPEQDAKAIASGLQS